MNATNTPRYLRRAGILCLLAGVLPVFAQTASSIEGQVVNAVSGAPLRNVQLDLRISMSVSGQPPASSFTAKTNEQGRFAVGGLPAGVYTLTARRQGFVDAVRSNIMLGEGQSMPNVVTRMAPHAVIVGKVVGSDGEPAANAQVVAYNWTYTAGVRQLTRWSSFPANDLGEYRVAGLPAGAYFVIATPSRSSLVSASIDQQLPDLAEEGDAPTFYPSSIDISAAKPVTVAAGAESQGINIKLAKAPAVTIRGRAIDAGPASGGSLSVTLTPRNLVALNVGSPTTYSMNNNVFMLKNVVPGSYDLFVRKSSGGITYAGVVPVEVGTKNIDNLSIRLSPPVTISGVVRSAPEGRCVASAITLRAGSGGPYNAALQSVSARDTFTLKDIQPSAYTLDVRPQQNCYLQAARYNGRDIAGGAFSVENAGSLEIFLAATTGSVSGTVRDAAGKPAGRVFVTITPRDGGAANFRGALTGQDGGFQLAGVAPGVYDAFAWQNTNQANARSSEYLKQFAAFGKQVTVSAAGPADVQLTVVPVSATGGQPPDPPAALGSLEGRVVSAADGSPLSEASVLLSRTFSVGPAATNSLTAETDAQGKFAIRDLDPGIYIITSQRRGFTRVEVPGGGSQRIVIGDGQRVSGFTLKMNPQGVLSGNVKDEYGEAVGNATVIAYLSVPMTYGGRRLTRIGAATTDDLGQFRIADAPPGTYYLGATRRMPARTVMGVPQTPAGPPETGFGYVWYPGSPAFDGATPVIAKGADVPNLDFVFRRTQLFRIRGTFRDPAGTPDQRMSIGVEPRSLGIGSTVGNTILGRDGTFEIANVPPGSYTLTARAGDGAAVRMASMPLEVRDANIQGIVLELAGGREIRGVLRFDNGPGYSTVMLMCVSGRTAQSARAAADGAFTISNLFPDVCSVNVVNLPNPFYVKSIRYGGTEASQGMVDFSVPGELEIAVGPNAASLDVVAVGRDGKPAPGAGVYLLPAAQTDAVRTAVADNMGRFSFTNLRPGAYNIYAWESGGPDGSRESLAQASAPGKAVILAENGNQSVQVGAIQPR